LCHAGASTTEHRKCPLRNFTSATGTINFGDVPIGLGKMLLFLSTKMLAMSQVELG
jgi:hypothetical protein